MQWPFVVRDCLEWKAMFCVSQLKIRRMISPVWKDLDLIFPMEVFDGRFECIFYLQFECNQGKDFFCEVVRLMNMSLHLFNWLVKLYECMSDFRGLFTSSLLRWHEMCDQPKEWIELYLWMFIWIHWRQM